MSENYLNNFKLAVSRHEELKNQKAIAEETISDCDFKIQALELEIQKATRNLSTNEKRHFRGEITETELEESRKAVRSFKDQLEGVEKRKQIALSVVPDIDRETLQISQAINSARFHFCNEVKDQISQSLATDKKINMRLVDAYVAMTVGGNFNGSWEKFLVSIFKRPSDPEIIEAANDFRKTHGIEEG